MKLAVSLLAMVLAAAGANAGTTVLYETGWEASPASPAWVPEALVYARNSWQPNPAPANSSHIVVANGSANSTIVVNGQSQTIVTPYGSQFHRFTASSSTTAYNGRYAWVDFGSAFNARPTGYNLVKTSIDFFVPANQSANDSYYGIVAFHGANVAWIVLIEPDEGVVFTAVDNPTQINGYASLFGFDTWFNLTVTANYDSGEVTFAIDGGIIPGLTRTSTFVASGGGFTTARLYCENSLTAPNPRVVFSDNYRVIAEGLTTPPPILTITPGPPVPIGDPPIWRLSWAAAFSTWTLESNSDLSSPDWLNEGAAGPAENGIVTKDVQPNPAPLHTFYRLRKP